MTSIRAARADDDDVLVRIDDLTWTAGGSPAPVPPADRSFFGEGREPGDALVAEVGGIVVGYVSLGVGFPIPAHAHVLEVTGVAVDPAYGGRGVGRSLVGAAVEMARDRGARKLGLRVLGHNARARGLYEACGFEVEGVLREEFLLDGRYTDDVLMARRLV